MAEATHTRTLDLAAKLDLEAADADDGKPVKFKLLANSGKPMRIRGFADPVIIDLVGVAFDQPATVVIADHNPSQRIGHCTDQQVTETGIQAFGIVSSDSEAAKGFVNDAKRGFPFQVSVGSSIEEDRYVRAGEQATVNGKTWQGPLIIAAKTRVREFSILTLGADSNTSARIAAKDSTMPATPEIEQAVQAERQRINDINAMLKPPSGKGWQWTQAEVDRLRAEAIEGTLAMNDLPQQVQNIRELEQIRADRPNASHFQPIRMFSQKGHSDSLEIECGLAQFMGIADEKNYAPETLERSRRLGICSLMDAARLCAQFEGKEFLPRSKDSILQAAFSTASFNTLLSNIANKSLEKAYNAFPSVARLVSRKLSARDFKDHTGVRLTGDVKMLEVGATGELKHSLLTDTSYTYRISTFGRIFGLNRQMIINDDLSALDDIPKMLGRGAALAREEEFWALVLAAADFFSVANGNLLTDPLNADGLAEGVRLFLEQTDQQGKPIGVTPRYLVVPPAKKVTADELYTSRTFQLGPASTNDNDKVPVVNAFFGLYEPAVSPWIGSKGLPGGNDDAWLLVGDPSDVAAFGIAYLDDKELPTIEQLDQSRPELLGVVFRGYIDLGVCRIDHRGAVKSTGTGE